MGVPPQGLTPDEYADSLRSLMGVGCPTPDKQRFPSFDGAINWRDGRKRKDITLYPYRCHGTAHWHLTKQVQLREQWDDNERQS